MSTREQPLPVLRPSLAPLTGALLGLLRARAGLTRSQLARFTGLTAQQINHWEQGRRPIPHKHQLKLAAVLAAAIPYAPANWARPGDTDASDNHEE